MRNPILFLLLFSINLFSQNAELGKVTKSELEEKFCPNDSSAVAAILFEKGMTFFDYDQDDLLLPFNFYLKNQSILEIPRKQLFILPREDINCVNLIFLEARAERFSIYKVKLDRKRTNVSLLDLEDFDLLD